MAEYEHEDRVRQRAYHLWLDEGKPEGQADAHWEKARELVAIEENMQDTLLPNPIPEYERNPTTEPVEPLLAVENEGEFPGLTDQGDDTYHIGEAAEPERPLRGPRSAEAMKD